MLILDRILENGLIQLGFFSVGQYFGLCLNTQPDNEFYQIEPSSIDWRGKCSSQN